MLCLLVLPWLNDIMPAVGASSPAAQKYQTEARSWPIGTVHLALSPVPARDPPSTAVAPRFTPCAWQQHYQS
uniref:Putative secreted peptide n=1 Tax=Anopheles braziliensis TaxID=58242 RepID=A0A2M3ZX31_9DIPT